VLNYKVGETKRNQKAGWRRGRKKRGVKVDMRSIKERMYSENTEREKGEKKQPEL